MTLSNSLSSTLDTTLDWNLCLRVSVPDPVPGYFDRPALIEQLMSTDHRIAVLKAPGGFGKTTLLAEYCRRLRERDLTTAWLRIDTTDTRSNMESYLTLAFRHLGVDVPEPDSDTRSVAVDRIELLLGAIAARTESCSLVLDNLERLTDPNGADAINTLLHYAPPNLHVTMACRELPFALDLTEPLLEGRVLMLTATDLRFSPQETANFLGSKLARRGLTDTDRRYAGWPIALALHRNSTRGSTSGQADRLDLLGNWIESRLWHHLSTDQRDFLLDAGLMDNLDPILLDEVLERSDSRYRLRAMPELDGLIQPFTGSGHGPGVLHPLLRQHCAERRIRETPERSKTIHQRAALAFERRGEVAASIRHAAEAGDPELLGRLIEDAGGILMWAHQAHFSVEEITSLLTYDVIKRWPRLALTHCYVLIFTDRIPEAHRLYELASASTNGFTSNPTGDVRDLHIDKFNTEMAFLIAGCTFLSSAELSSVVAGAFAIAQDEDLEPSTRAILIFGLSIYESRRARFDAVFESIEQIRQLIGDSQFPYLSIGVDLHLGNMAMVQGHVQEAETCYASAIRSAHAYYPDDPTSGAT